MGLGEKWQTCVILKANLLHQNYRPGLIPSVHPKHHHPNNPPLPLSRMMNQRKQIQEHYYFPHLHYSQSSPSTIRSHFSPDHSLGISRNLIHQAIKHQSSLLEDYIECARTLHKEQFGAKLIVTTLVVRSLRASLHQVDRVYFESRPMSEGPTGAEGKHPRRSRATRRKAREDRTDLVAGLQLHGQTMKGWIRSKMRSDRSGTLSVYRCVPAFETFVLPFARNESGIRPLLAPTLVLSRNN